MVERSNKTIKAILRALNVQEKDNWDELLRMYLWRTMRLRMRARDSRHSDCFTASARIPCSPWI